MVQIMLLATTMLDAQRRPSRLVMQAREQCFSSGRLRPEQRRHVDRHEFPDRPDVRSYVHCFWTRLHLWQDAHGFNVQAIVYMFGGPEHVNVEQAVPAINGCNASARSNRTVASPQKWCYEAFVCVLRTPVGVWYRRYMSDVLNGNA
ncbi:uncharacterized protein LOC115630197 [Scaptodrosophila lebanonensis]|uniref:Uncharacterized protein LOC115630197 n=1 Tax=Drosophila lebanonensis TaxID=7225 RepID=A0A6J2U3Y8_DROLE|nr:uncharacterized protein LOC115630197 [Scaptodrosophila lebanonensis]